MCWVVIKNALKMLKPMLELAIWSKGFLYLSLPCAWYQDHGHLHQDVWHQNTLFDVSSLPSVSWSQVRYPNYYAPCYTKPDMAGLIFGEFRLTICRSQRSSSFIWRRLRLH